MAQSIYDDLSDDYAQYFLDKTPRYHLIANELIDTIYAQRSVTPCSVGKQYSTETPILN